MLVAPAGSLKTTLTELMDSYSKTLLLSDLTIRQASLLRSDMISGKIVTLAFSDYAKLYQRQSAIAANVEGFIRGIVGEGYRNVNWEDARATSLPARSLCMAAMTDSFYKGHYSAWIEDGIARRFLWCHFKMSRESNIAVTDALRQGRRLHIGSKNGFDARVPTQMIPQNVTEQESRQLLFMLKDQPCDKIPIVMFRKMLSALKWKFNSSKAAMNILRQFSECLSKNGAELDIMGDIIKDDDKPKRKKN